MRELKRFKVFKYILLIISIIISIPVFLMWMVYNEIKNIIVRIKK
jgi:hypothetical protein